MAYTQVPIFITKVLGAPVWTVGLIEGIAESVASLMKLAAGWFSDLVGRRKPLVMLGYGLGAVSKPLLSLASAWPLVLLFRFMDRFGKGLRTAPRDALISEATDPSIRGRAFGLHRAMDTTGAVIGPLLGFWFLTHVSPDLRKMFLFAGIPGVLAVATLAAAIKEPRVPAMERPRGSRPALPLLRDLSPVYKRYLLAVFIFNLGNSSDAFLILRARHIGFDPQEILLLYAAFNLVEALLGYSAGNLSDRVGRRPLMFAGYAVFATVYLGFAFASQRWHIWALFLLYGGYYTLTQGVQRALAADLADPSQRATQIGAFHFVVGIAALPASIIAGALFQYSSAWPFEFGALLAAVGCVALMTVRPHEVR
jgi:MFS family permease